jgi:glyoxylase-like metal-dependent hydrolase (beta-lactamase superfamily II)
MSEQYEVLAVRYGTRQASAAEIFLNYHAYREPDRPLGMDYFFWIARNPARAVLVDTGFSQAGGAARGRTMFMDTVPALQAAHTTPDQVSHVVLTHAHYDHIGGLPVLAKGEVVMTHDEYDFWTGPMGRRGQFAYTTEESELRHLRELRATGRLTLAGQAHQIAPGVELIQVGGHTPGQAIVTVATAAGPVVLASDAVHYYEELERDRPFSDDVTSSWSGAPRCDIVVVRVPRWSPDSRHFGLRRRFHHNRPPQDAVATLARASASSAGRVNMDSWLPGTVTGVTPSRAAKRSQPYSPGGSATSSADST